MPDKIPLISNTTVGGAVVTTAGALSVNDLVMLGGFVLAIFGALSNWYYRHREDKRRQAAHEADMRERSHAHR